jgi:hypothetical protein
VLSSQMRCGACAWAWQRAGKTVVGAGVSSSSRLPCEVCHVQRPVVAVCDSDVG